MEQFLSAILLNDGIVFAADVEEPIIPSFQKINEHVMVLLGENVENGRSFCNEYLSKFVSMDWNFDLIVTEIKQILGEPTNPYKDKTLVLGILGFEKNFEKRQIVMISYINNKVKINKIPQGFVFSLDSVLANHLTNKVYSAYMPLDDGINLLAYIHMQYHILFGCGNHLTIGTITKEKGYKLLSKTMVSEILRKMEKVDLNLKKLFYNFFVEEKK